jgi:hypothetical protein
MNGKNINLQGANHLSKEMHHKQHRSRGNTEWGSGIAGKQYDTLPLSEGKVSVMLRNTWESLSSSSGI